MNDVMTKTNNEVMLQDLTVENRIAIINEGIRKKYLTRLNEMQIVPCNQLLPLEEDLIENVRLYHITEMVYQKGELAIDKFTTVFNTLSTYKSSIFIILDSDGKKTDFYIGVRNNQETEELKRSSVTLGDTLKNTLIGHFPGVKIENENRKKIAEISNRITQLSNVTSVSVVGNNKSTTDKTNEEFVQGLEKLILAMDGRKYIGVLVAENQDAQNIQNIRDTYQDIYTKISPLQKVQFSENESNSTSRAKAFNEMTGKQKAAMVGSAAVSLAGVVGGALVGGGAFTNVVSGALKDGLTSAAKMGAPGGAMVGGQIGGQFNGFINSLAPSEQITKSYATTTTTTTENKTITDMMQLIDDSLKRLNEFDSYGMWNVAGYFVSNDMATAEIAASNYNSLMKGENSGREVSAINSWRQNDSMVNGNFKDLTLYLSRFMHPKFYYGGQDEHGIMVDGTTAISGKELGLHLGFPRYTVPGLPVIEHAEFGKEVTKYQLFAKKKELAPEERMTLGKVFDLGRITHKVVELENKSLNMHTFITGSTGSGKSNTVYQMLSELHQDSIPWLVIEPAKGEYKDVFGNWNDVNVYSTNPKVAELINLNPFRFPDSIHVLEHIDGLVEIFSACWPMYDAMPAFFKEAILKSYESVGWDLGSSIFQKDQVEYPDFELLVEKLEEAINESDYASDIKSNYRGALITRVKSLTVGLNKFIFTSNQTPYKKIFDENCILDISRIKSTETKALIMGMMVYILNEYRVDQKTSNNNGLKHITVLEEAHNLLKNTAGSGGENNLVGKSVEMLTQTIAEIRTYGEGFIIVDQSPSSVDISAIKNTNTKIVLRTPEANDREAVGRSMGLTENQVNEIAKLPSGVAVVYQNDWVNPVLTMIDKAAVEESAYVPRKVLPQIETVANARAKIVKMLLAPWIGKQSYTEEELNNSLMVLEISHQVKDILKSMVTDYFITKGFNTIDNESYKIILLSVLGITSKKLEEIENVKQLASLLEGKINHLQVEDMNVLFFILKG